MTLAEKLSAAGVALATLVGLAAVVTMEFDRRRAARRRLPTVADLMAIRVPKSDAS